MGPIPRQSLHNFRSMFAGVKCVIVDEVSMISNDLLHKINQRLQEATGDLNEAFGGIDIIFCGDFRQLPPAPVYRGTRRHTEGHLLWHSLDYFALDQVVRQSTTRYSNILTKIGDGMALTAAEAQMIESRFRTTQWCEENLSGLIRLFQKNNSVDEYNKRIIQGGSEYQSTDFISGYSNNDELVSARAKLHRMNTMETCGLPYCVKLSPG